MKTKCDKCGIEDKGHIKKLIKRGWKFYFFKEKGLKVSICKECKPHFKDKIKKFFDKNYKTEMEKQIGIKINKIKTLYALKDEEGKSEEKNKKTKRVYKSSRNYHYKTNHNREDGSTKGGSLLRRK